MPSHTQIDATSRELGIAVARRLRSDRALLDVAIGNLTQWLSRDISASLRAAYTEWKEILDGGDVDSIAEILEGDSEENRRLRQNSPFAGVLSPREVWKIKEAARHATARS